MSKRLYIGRTIAKGYAKAAALLLLVVWALESKANIKEQATINAYTGRLLQNAEDAFSKASDMRHEEKRRAERAAQRISEAEVAAENAHQAWVQATNLYAG